MSKSLIYDLKVTELGPQNQWFSFLVHFIASKRTLCTNGGTPMLYLCITTEQEPKVNSNEQIICLPLYQRDRQPESSDLPNVYRRWRHRPLSP